MTNDYEFVARDKTEPLVAISMKFYKEKITEYIIIIITLILHFSLNY